MMAFPRELLEEFRGDAEELRNRQRVALQDYLQRDDLRRNMAFVDDSVRERQSQKAKALVAEAQSEWEQDVLQCQQLLVEGVDASSTDNEEQGIGNTLQYGHSGPPQRPWQELFWSSTGSDEEDATEHLTYRMRFPLSALHSVKFQVFRARYQPGEPIYPPREVMVEVGPSLRSLHPVTGWQSSRISCSPQTIHIPPNTGVGQYLRINFRGKLQFQVDDMRRYLAIRRVWAYGWQVQPQHLQTYRLRQLQSPRGAQVYNGTHGSALQFGCLARVRPVEGVEGKDGSKRKAARKHDSPPQHPDHDVGLNDDDDDNLWRLPPLPAK